MNKNIKHILKTLDGASITEFNDNTSEYRYDNGDKFYFKNDKLHCLTGPAKIAFNEQLKQWWIEGEEVSEEYFNKYINLLIFT